MSQNCECGHVPVRPVNVPVTGVKFTDCGMSVDIDAVNLPDAGSGDGGVPLFTVIWSAAGMAEPGYADLSQQSGILLRSAYPGAWAKLERMIAANMPNVVSDDTWLAELEANGGTCGKFSTGDGATTFRIPLLRKRASFGFPDPTVNAKHGDFLADQMRPIAGQSSIPNLQAGNDTHTGPFYTDGTKNAAGVGTEYRMGACLRNKFDSARLGSNYSGDITHGPLIIYTPLMKVGGGDAGSGEGGLVPDLRFGEESLWPSKYNGKQVYAKLLNFGALPAPYGMRGVTHGVTDIEWKQISWEYSTIGKSADTTETILSAASTLALNNGNLPWRFAVNNTAVTCNMLTMTDYREWDDVRICLLYTKK